MGVLVRTAVTGAAAVVVIAGLAAAGIDRLDRLPVATFAHPAIAYDKAPTSDPVDELNARLEAGSTRLVFEPTTGYLRSVLDALEARYPMLCGTIRDHSSGQRRPFIRFFACEEDHSHEPVDAPLPEAVASGAEPYLIIGALAGG